MRLNSRNTGFQNPIKTATEKYFSGRLTLLLVAALSLLNVILLVSGGNVYFVFSATIPYLLVDIGMFLCGLYPESFYEGGYDAYYLIDGVFIIPFIALAILIIAFYVVCFFLTAKGRVGWLIASLSLFAIDTVVLLTQYDIMSSLLDILMHAFVIVSLATAISAYFKLKKLSAEIESTPRSPWDLAQKGEEENDEEKEEKPYSDKPDTQPIRYAQENAKARVLLEADVYGRKVVYRRVKTTNELVIDGRVYAEYTAFLEKPHLFTAIIDGHAIEAGTVNGSQMVIAVDGKTVVSKIRWI